MTEREHERETSGFERALLAWERPFVRWIAVAVAAGCVFAVVLANRSGGQPMVASKTTTTGAEVNLAAPSSSQSPSSVPPGEVVVDVAGAVRRPGIQRLPAGSRVIDAVKAAGGVKMGQAGVNLARVLVDGEQIVIGAVAAGSLTSGSTGSGGSAPVGGQKVNLNTATATQLEELPRIGPSKAAKIIEFRNQNGGFRSVEQLREIAGIGDVTFSELSQLVTV